MRKIILLAICLFSFVAGNATKRYSNVASGDWESSGSWTGGSVPQNGDTIFIQAGHTITVNTVNTTLQSGAAVYLEIYGTLNFATGKKLSLACGSGVALKQGPPAGRITAGSGGGNSNQLTICGNTVWSAADGNKSGPLAYGSPLPVKLISFNALLDENKVDITWTTASEVNNDYFTIERSKDGKQFEEVAKVKGAGTTNSMMEYFETDYEPLTGISYYRLKQTDFDGTFTYSPLVPVNFTAKGSDDKMKIFPNPIASTDRVYVEVPAAELETLVVLRDMAGTEHYSKVVLSAQGNQLVAIDLEKKLVPGTYLVVASSNNKIFSEKLIVK